MIEKFATFINEHYSSADIDDILFQIDKFLKSSLRSLWIGNSTIKIYIRKSKRHYKGSMIDCFDFATIETTDPGHGLFTKILKKFEETYPTTNIYIESVITDQFKKTIIDKYGFETFDDNNFFKVK